MVVVSVLAWLFLVERGRSPMMACTVYGIFQWFRGVISERLAGWQVRLVGHFAATVIFTFAATFIARGVKRGEQVNMQPLCNRMHCMMVPVGLRVDL